MVAHMDSLDHTAARLGVDAARRDPCAGCSASCCTYLPLHDFQITRYEELDYARYLSNFERIELAMLSGGSWRVHYRASCHHLDTASRRCTVHGTPQQPMICKRFSAHSCFYKRLFESPSTVEYIRMDAARLELWASMLVFDGHRDIVGVPDVALFQQLMPPLSPPPEADPAIPPAPLLAQWEQSVRAGMPLRPLGTRRFSDFDAPCAGCTAWCCTTLSFSHSAPASYANVDHLRFCLGFPGVEVGIDERDQWTVIVRTRCRSLRREADGSGRCGVHGLPERPTVCGLYDASVCGYKAQHGHPRPARFLRIRASEFSDLAALFVFDDNGYVLQRPTYAHIRHRIEARWLEEG